MTVRFASSLAVATLLASGCYQVVRFPEYSPKASEAKGQLIDASEKFDQDMEACLARLRTTEQELNFVSLGIWTYDFGSGLATVLGSFLLGVTAGSANQDVVHTGAITAGGLGAISTLLLGIRNYSGIAEKKNLLTAEYYRRADAIRLADRAYTALRPDFYIPASRSIVVNEILAIRRALVSTCD